MSIVSLFVVFAVSWWMVLLMLLPIGVKTEENPEAGHANSAPKKSFIKRKMLGATVIALFITGVYSLFSLN